MSVTAAEVVAAWPYEGDVIAEWPMSWDEYDKLPEYIRAEYVDGIVLVKSSPSRAHQRIVGRLWRLVEDALPDCDVISDVDTKTLERRIRRPDLVVFPEREDTTPAESVAVLAVEVLSPGTRGEDTIRKADEYRRAGIGQYWLVDRDSRTLTVLVNGADDWQIALLLDSDHPAGEVVVGEHGSVALDLGTILGA